MRVKTILTLLGVAFQTFCIMADQSELGNQPMNVRERRDTPEVVLQLKYDGGELNKIYLTQFRKDNTGAGMAVPARASLCADLCHAGLGGNVCGSTCQDMLPIGLKSALHVVNATELQYGEPRVAVCPALCNNGLGQPLCNCYNDTPIEAVDWTSVCETFCTTDKYVLQGCPVCEESAISPLQTNQLRILNTSEGWKTWCNVQCKQGQGGAACNCDRSPFL